METIIRDTKSAAEVVGGFEFKIRSRTPEQDAAFKAERDSEEAWQKNRAIEDLRRIWGAPKRHCDKPELNMDGPWGKAFNSLKEKLGTGFLVGIVGKRGPGKTQLGVALMYAATKAHRSAKFCTATEFFMEIKSTYRKNSQYSELDTVKDFRKPSLLVIDEIGRRGETDWENNLLFELLNKRYDDQTDTFVISNQPRPEFSQALGDSLISRMTETGGLIVCDDWPSFRITTPAAGQP